MQTCNIINQIAEASVSVPGQDFMIRSGCCLSAKKSFSIAGLQGEFCIAGDVHAKSWFITELSFELFPIPGVPPLA